VARSRGEQWLDSYGGYVGLEWLQPKVLEVFDIALWTLHPRFYSLLYKVLEVFDEDPVVAEAAVTPTALLTPTPTAL